MHGPASFSYGLCNFYTYEEHLLSGVIKCKCFMLISYDIFISAKFVLVKYSVRSLQGTSSLGSQLTTMNLDHITICDCLCENQPSLHHKLIFFSVQLVAMYNS